MRGFRKNSRRALKTGLQGLLNTLLPPRCLLTEKKILTSPSRPSAFSGLLSEEAELPEYLHEEGRLCTNCGEPLAVDEECQACILYPMPVDSIRSLWRYSGEIRNLIRSLKFKGNLQCATFFGAAFSEAIASGLFEGRTFDAICPLPSSPEATRERGYSHTSLMARALSKSHGVEFFPLTLRSRRKREHQFMLTLLERRKNVELAFAVRGNKLENKRLLLVDDVLTSGASVTEAAEVLLEAGVLSVDVLTIARSYKFSRNRLRLGLSSTRPIASKSLSSVHA